MWQGKLFFLLLVCSISPWFAPVVVASTPRACGDDLQSTIGQMLPQLPAYANRAFNRRRPPQEPYTPTYVILAGNPEFEPLCRVDGETAIGRGVRNRFSGSFPVSGLPTLPTLPPSPSPEAPPSDGGSPCPPSPGGTGEPQQAFITTLERQYTPNGVVFLQRFHWLFLTKAADGWQLVQMFSIQGPTRGQPPTPPEESRDSFIGEAIRSWLQDCRPRRNRVS